MTLRCLKVAAFQILTQQIHFSCPSGNSDKTEMAWNTTGQTHFDSKANQIPPLPLEAVGQGVLLVPPADDGRSLTEAGLKRRKSLKLGFRFLWLWLRLSVLKTVIGRLVQLQTLPFAISDQQLGIR